MWFYKSAIKNTRHHINASWLPDGNNHGKKSMARKKTVIEDSVAWNFAGEINLNRLNKL